MPETEHTEQASQEQEQTTEQPGIPIWWQMALDAVDGLPKSWKQTMEDATLEWTSKQELTVRVPEAMQALLADRLTKTLQRNLQGVPGYQDVFISIRAAQ